MLFDRLKEYELRLYAARTMQVCPYTVRHKRIGNDEWDTDVQFTLVDENFIWDEGAHHYFEGSDLCDVLILKSTKWNKSA